MKLHRFQVMTLGVLAVLVMTMETARAGTIIITDVGEGTPTVQALSNSGAPIAVAIQTDSTAEFLHFTFNSTEQIFANSFIRGRDLVEGDRSVSDRLIVTATAAGSTLYDVQFASDPSLLTFPGNINLIDPVLAEDGTVQQMFDITTVGGQKSGTDFFFVQSDVEAVPEPASVALLLVGGLGCLAGSTWRRRRNSAA